MTDLQQAVALSADAADLHANAPTLILELQTLLGSLAATVVAGTDRGRRPFRPGDDWPTRLGELAYGIYLLGDQTGVDVATAVQATARIHSNQGQRARAQDDNAWPFGS